MFKRIMKRLEEVAEESERRERKKAFVRNLKHGKPHGNTKPPLRFTGSTGAR